MRGASSQIVVFAVCAIPAVNSLQLAAALSRPLLQRAATVLPNVAAAAHTKRADSGLLLMREPWEAAEPEPEPEINMAETATAAIDSIMQMCGDETDPPRAMLGLKNAVQGGDKLTIGAALYDLLIEQALDYDMAEGQVQQRYDAPTRNAQKILPCLLHHRHVWQTMVKTSVDYTNKEDPEVLKKLRYIYSYGISMLQKGTHPKRRAHAPCTPSADFMHHACVPC